MVSNLSRVWYKSVNEYRLLNFLNENNILVDCNNYQAIIWDTDEMYPQNEENVYIVRNGNIDDNKKILSFSEYSDILKILDVEIEVCKNYINKWFIENSLRK